MTTTVTWWASVQLGATLLTTALATSSVYAQADGYKLQLDLLPILPAYCRHVKGYRDVAPGGDDRQATERWEKLMGVRNFMHMHHYCHGLANTHHAQLKAKTKQERDWWLEQSIQEFDFVLRHGAQDFVMRPEILTKRGENLLRLGRAPEAISNFMRAIDIKPDYWPPYAALGDHYKEAGDTEKARTWLEKGLAASPGAKPLQERLNKVSHAPAK